MEQNLLHIPSSASIEHMEYLPLKRITFPAWLLQNRNLPGSHESLTAITQNDLINLLNRLHFLGEDIFFHLYRSKYSENVLVRARIQSVRTDELVCIFNDDSFITDEINDFEIMHLLVDDGKKLVVMQAAMKDIKSDSCTVILPKEGFSISCRRTRRYPCRNIAVELIQNELTITGRLLDFSPSGFRMGVSRNASSTLSAFNSDAQVFVLLRRDSKPVFSSICRCIRFRESNRMAEIVLLPEQNIVKRFKPRAHRNPRRCLSPAPTIVFDHPLIEKKVVMDVHNISTSGVSVYEKPDDAVLMAGLIIRDLVIDYVGAASLKCSAQVIYRGEEEAEGIRCGLVITDMDINTYSALCRIMFRAVDPHSHVSHDISMDALWELLFETGFIYPGKYCMLQADREKFKETYRKLYQDNPEIAKHFTYEKNGRIFAHVSMVRAYERTWLIHHHTAKSMEGRRVGFQAVKQVTHYLNDLHRLPSAKTDFALVFFRPDKKIPRETFGGFVADLNNPRACSMDLFTYLPYTGLSLNLKLPRNWTLEQSTAPDLRTLVRFYEHNSGGLLLEATGLDGDFSGNQNLERIYENLGFFRRITPYSLREEGRLVAVFLVDRSERGLNLSELLNSIKVLVLEQDILSWDILSIAISQMTGEYRMNQVPVLFYPAEYIEARGIPYTRKYCLCVLHLKYLNKYMDYTMKRFRLSYE